jgi:hypothetical protein
MVRNPILREDGIVYCGQWEPIYFSRQNGHNSENIEARYAFEFSEAYVARLAALGVNQLWTRFYKGYGLAFEDAEQQKMCGLVARCHRHGIRVFAYCTFGTLTLHSLLAEEAGAADWVAKPDLFAHAAYSNYQCFRARVDYTCREWLDYMVRVVDKALDMGADGIHFDNTEMSVGFEACRCARCTRLFREFLAARYGTRSAATRRAGTARYGTNDFAHIEPPWFTLGQHPVNQRQLLVPLQQDWVTFRCEAFTAALRRLTEHIRGRGRLVEANLGKNENTNNPYYRGLDYARVFPLVDCAFHEDLDRPGFNRLGTPVCAIRSFKVADSFGLPLMVYALKPLELMESFALNPGGCGLASPFMDRSRQRQFAFIRRWRHYNTTSASLAQVAVLRHRLSLACDSYYPAQTSSAVEQVLQEEHVPFDILAESQLDRLTRYTLLVIPGMRWMRDDEGAAIARWVRAGGRLLLVGEVGIRNELNQVRSAVKTIRTLDDFRRAGEAAPLFARVARKPFDKAFTVRAGGGRVAFLPALDHAAVPGTETADWRIERDHLNVPRNAAVVREALLELLGDRQRLRVEAPRQVVVEFRRRTDTGEGAIHLLNLGWERQETTAARVAFRWPHPVACVTALRWEAEPARLPVGREGPFHVCDVSGIREHVMLVIPAGRHRVPRPAPARRGRRKV